MASDYGLNFGFRRSDESYRSSEGRFRTPATGPVLLQGSAVTIDPANPGFMKVAASNAPLVPGVTGLLIQEDAMFGSIYAQDVANYDSTNLGVTKPNRLAVITTGAAVKVWFKNTGAQARIDGRNISAVTVANLTGVALGDTMGWNGTTWVKVTSADAAWMTVTSVNTASGYFEGVLLK